MCMLLIKPYDRSMIVLSMKTRVMGDQWTEVEIGLGGWVLKGVFYSNLGFSEVSNLCSS